MKKEIEMKRDFPYKSDFEKKVLDYCKDFGGLKNMHIHGDRAYTRKDEFYSHIGKSIQDLENASLPEKQKLTWALHKGRAFHSDCLRERGERLLDESIKFGVTELNTTVDITYNTKLKSLEVWEKLKKDYSEKIKVNIFAYNPSGFKVKGLDDERYELFEEGVRRADGMVALAEKDRKEGHIGERQHNLYLGSLSHKFQKPVQYHVGQENRPFDKTIEILLEDLAFLQDVHFRESPNIFPKQFIVHGISSSCKSEEELNKIINETAKRDISLIICSRAALSMYQDKKILAPIHNSIAKAWNYITKGVNTFLGVDNLNDIFVPASSPDLYEESEYLANSLRGYSERLLAKILCGKKFDDFDRGSLERIIKD
jgi:cytosine/creatinine deaminase